MVLLLKFIKAALGKNWVSVAKRADPNSTMIFKGEEAYEFLLRFACGMESHNVGEQFVLPKL